MTGSGGGLGQLLGLPATVLGRTGKPGSFLSLSVFLICFCFLIIFLCFEFRKNTKAFPKILKIFMDTC